MCNNCQNSNCTDCGHLGLEYCTDGFCEEKLDSACVIYKHNQEESNLNCITDISPNTSVEQILEIWDKELCNKSGSFRDEKVSVSGEDEAGYLYDKLVVDECLIKSIEQGKLKISIDFSCICSKLTLLDCASGGNTPCTPLALIPNITTASTSYCGTNNIVLVAANYNGDLQWFKDGVPIPNATNFSLVVEGVGGTYYIKNTTQCSFEISNSLNIVYSEDCDCNPQATIPTVTPSSGSVNENQTILLTANDCNGTLSWYNSQNQLVGSGQTIAVGAGNYYARCSTICNNANSQVVSIVQAIACPTISASITSINPTCSGNTLQNNGEIVVGNIINGMQISIDGGSYAPLNGLGGTDNSHKYLNVSVGSHLIRIKPTNSSCAPEEFVAVITSTSCGCLPISGNIPTTTNATCTGNTPNTDGSIIFSGLQNVTRISYSSICNNNTWGGSQAVTGNSHVINNLPIGTYFIRYYTTEQCFSSCVTVNIISNCCDLDINNPNLVC